MLEKNHINNPSSGIGDPYWYEWSVGLFYALDMLNPDTGIEHITLQSKDFQGLDDVVIKYLSGNVTGIQVKHTRKNDTLTYTDLVFASKKDSDSLLRQLCKDWKRALADAKYDECEVILFTNRKTGVRWSTVAKGAANELQCPPLGEFLSVIESQIVSAKQIQEITFEKILEPAWERFLCELSPLDTDEQKLRFLNNLKIKTNQDDLEELIENINKKIATYLCADSRMTKQFDYRLCAALRKWATTIRKNEYITKEDLYAALALNQDNFAGDHNLPICEPFFTSRLDFISNLETKLENREYPIIFLSGDPGSGKTNIINQLANKSNSIITLRFHAFKPIMPGDTHISADTGICDARSFWSDLLIQLRDLLTGHLSEYNVPVCNAMIDSIDRLRAEVLRLSSAYANLQSKTTVIAVDGIDHAARAGGDNSFLSTLIPPQSVPEDVCFIIAGQPLVNYDAYPDWLSDIDNVKVIVVPLIVESDIKSLLDVEGIVFNDCTQERASEIIYHYTNGNTLSSVFAVYECKNVKEISVLEEKLKQSGMSQGIQQYYEYIWKEAKKHIPVEFFYLDTRIAATLSLLSKHITPTQLNFIFNDSVQPEALWSRVLSSLYPIVIREDNGFRIFHNDVRIYLEKYIRKDMNEFHSICLRLSTYLFEESDDIELKHEMAFNLLVLGCAEDQALKRYTIDYVTEAIQENRPMIEIEQQMEMTLRSMNYSNNFEDLLSFSCAINTLNQYTQSLEWLDKKHIGIVNLPLVLPCEKKVLGKRLFTKPALKDMLGQAKRLINANEITRGQKILDYWLGNLTPYSLVELLTSNEDVELDISYVHNDDVVYILKTWGAICCASKSIFGNLDSNNDADVYKYSFALWSSGWLNEAQNRQPNDCIKFITENGFPCLVADIEKCFIDCLKNESQETILRLVDKTHLDKFTSITKLYWVCWAVFNRRCDLCVDLLIEILDRKLEFLVVTEYDRNNETNFLCCALIMLILSVYKNIEVDDFESFVKQSLQKARGFEVKKDDRGYFSANNLLLSMVLLGELIADIQSGRIADSVEDHLKLIIDTVFDDRDSLGCAEIHGWHVKQFLLKSIISLEDGLPRQYSKLITDHIILGARNTDSLTCINTWWNYLRDKQERQVLQEIFCKWLNADTGIAWNNDLYNKYNIADQILPLAMDLGLDNEIEAAKHILKYAKIGYSGHKDYSLYNTLNWFKTLEKDKISWDYPGLYLLNISESASLMGDNRASVPIDGAVATVIGHHGVNAIDKFLRIINPPDWNGLTIILDAVIASLENCYFTGGEILDLWKTVVTITNINHDLPEYDSNNSHRIIYLVHLRYAIMKHIENNQVYADLPEEMRRFAPFEYDIRCGPESIMFIIPDRWFEKSMTNTRAKEFIEKIEAMDNEQAFIELLEIIESQAPSRWDSCQGFIEKLISSGSDVSLYLNKVLEMILQSREKNYWEYDGVYRLLEFIFPLTNEIQRSLLLKDIYAHYTHRPYMYNLCDDFDKFLFWHNNDLSHDEKLRVVTATLNMHRQWITAFGTLDYTPKYINDETIQSDASWHSLCLELRRRFSSI